MHAPPRSTISKHTWPTCIPPHTGPPNREPARKQQQHHLPATMAPRVARHSTGRRRIDSAELAPRHGHKQHISRVHSHLARPPLLQALRPLTLSNRPFLHPRSIASPSPRNQPAAPCPLRPPPRVPCVRCHRQKCRQNVGTLFDDMYRLCPAQVGQSEGAYVLRTPRDGSWHPSSPRRVSGSISHRAGGMSSPPVSPPCARMHTHNTTQTRGAHTAQL
mmetsp:Transcript_10639/g.27812  ORF Transcript_10639/g.27812 Transcript_10639/m.27812 type:complete len:218 (-) Transcript_10639:137-790(-)